MVRSTVSDKARRHLRQLIETSLPGTRLPPLNACAKAAGVSLKTMWAASQRFKRDGKSIFDTVEEGELRLVCPDTSTNPHGTPFRTRVQTLLELRDRYTSMIRANPDQSHQALADVLGTIAGTIRTTLNRQDMRTVQQALLRLVSDGYIGPYKRDLNLCSTQNNLVQAAPVCEPLVSCLSNGNRRGGHPRLHGKSKMSTAPRLSWDSQYEHHLYLVPQQSLCLKRAEQSMNGSLAMVRVEQGFFR